MAEHLGRDIYLDISENCSSEDIERAEGSNYFLGDTYLSTGAETTLLELEPSMD